MELNEFLVKAKINTYASNGENKERKLEDGSKELVYEDGEWKYRDRYFGFNPFIGEEVVWKNDGVVWGMNYYGTIIGKETDAKSLYQFLQKAMRLVKSERPFRGPTEFCEGDWKYTDESLGGTNKFKGTEIIYLRGEKAYELKYHGGSIVKR